MKEPQTSTGCLGVNHTPDIETVQTPNGVEWIVQLGVFGTKNLQGHYYHPIDQAVINKFNDQKNNEVTIPSGRTPAERSRVDASMVCATVTALEALPLGDKQILKGRVRPTGPLAHVLLDALEHKDKSVMFGFSGLVHVNKRDGATIAEVEVLRGFHLIFA